ncbi:hypothetical protein D9M70_569290 [compost metagenome]
MRHLRADMQPDIDPLQRGAPREFGRIAEQDLIGADLDQHRRQSGQVAEQRRDQRIVGGLPGPIGVGTRDHGRTREHRIERGAVA